MKSVVYQSIVLLCLSLPVSVMGNTSQAQWQKYADNLKTESGLVRFYSFKNAEEVQPDLAGSQADMKLKLPKDASLQTEPGRIVGSLAVTLDAESFRAPVIVESNNAISVSIWLKPLGTGVKQTGGRENGMIASSGSGYYDGWRITIYDMAKLTPSFEIGKGKNSISVMSKESLGRDCWNHIAATWDGALMKIYVNGVFGGSTVFSGPYQPAKSELAVGYSGYGVGSCKMTVDELAVFNTAIPPAKVTALSLTMIDLGDEINKVVNSAHELELTGKSVEASELLEKLSQDTTLSTELMGWCKVAAWYYSSNHKISNNSISQCVKLWEDQSIPPQLKGKLLTYMLECCRSASGLLPSRILEVLPSEIDLSEEDKFTCAVALARSYADEKQTEKSQKVFEHLIELSVGDVNKLPDLQFQLAQSFRNIGKNTEAVQQYQDLANNKAMPVSVRTIAVLSLARTLQGEKKYDEAIKAYQVILATEKALPHHKFEAESGIHICENLKAGKAARDPEEFRERLAPFAVPAVTLYVSPDGSDQNPGTLKKPFASIIKARDFLRELKIEKGGLPVGGVTVYLRGGRYTMGETLELTKEDSGKYGAPVVYAAYKDEIPVFDGSFTVKKFRKVRDQQILNRLPEEAHGRVYVADLKAQGFKDFEPQKGYGYGVNNEAIRLVYEDESFMPISRWPNNSRIPMVELIEGNDKAFKVDCDRLSRWTTADDMMTDGFWYHLWAGEALHVESVDPAKGIITLAKKPGRGLKQGRPFCVMNLLEEIDLPGEWFIDCKNGLLYIWLQKHPWFTDVVVSERKENFITANDVQDIAFKGITFQYGQNRAAEFNNCVNLKITDCRFHGFGGTALLVLNAANAKIYGNRLDTLGHGGMRVTGGNRKNLTSGGIVIENNEVGHFGLCSRTYVPAILLEGVGTKVRHNYFHHAPSSAMRIEGNDHLVEYNLGEFLVQESDDQGAIDMWSNASYRGCVMRYNHWRDVSGGDVPCGQGGIRFDDAISGMVVYGNIFERTSNGHFGGVQIHGGHMNIIDNNIFIDCNHAVSFSPWSLERFQKYINEGINAKLYKEVNIDLPPYSDRYPSLKALKDDSRHNISSVWRNIITGTDTPFYHAPKGTDFCDNQIMESFSMESPYIKNSTFCEIPVSEIGRYK